MHWACVKVGQEISSIKHVANRVTAKQASWVNKQGRQDKEHHSSIQGVASCMLACSTQDDKKGS